MNTKIKWLREKIKMQNMQAIIISNPYNIKYLTGIEAEGTLIIARKENFFLTDGRYLEAVKSVLTIDDEIVVTDISKMSREDYETFFIFCENVGFEENYITLDIHDFLIKCVHGHCNIIVSGETGSGKTEFVKYLAAHTLDNEKIITIEDTLELHLDRIFPHRSIIAMKTNNIASYSDILITCMRQNPRWILLSEVRSAEAVMAVRNSISSGHNILSTIHADKAASIPVRMYSLLETNQDIDQFLRSIHRYVQLGVHIRGYYSPQLKRFQREVCEVEEFYVDDITNEAKTNCLYRKTMEGQIILQNPTKYLRGYLESQGVIVDENVLVKGNASQEQDIINKTIVNTESLPNVSGNVGYQNQPIVNAQEPQVNNQNFVNMSYVNSVQSGINNNV